jgi:hypothetical protein
MCKAYFVESFACLATSVSSSYKYYPKKCKVANNNKPCHVTKEAGQWLSRGTELYAMTQPDKTLSLNRL